MHPLYRLARRSCFGTVAVVLDQYAVRLFPKKTEAAGYAYRKFRFVSESMTGSMSWELLKHSGFASTSLATSMRYDVPIAVIAK